MKLQFILPLLVVFFVTACGGSFTANDTSATITATANLDPGQGEPAARIIFSASNFTLLNDFTVAQNTSHQCLGDILSVYYANGPDYTGLPNPFPTPSFVDSLLPTNRPIFIRNVSVDITNTYFPITQSNVVATDHCSYRGVASMPAPSSCADFDQNPAAAPLPTIAPTVTPSPVPVASATPSPTDPGATQYYNTGFYQVRDDWCTSQGPTVDPDPEVTKAGVGGVSIDIDRTQLGSNEDLLMLVTYHALNANSGSSNAGGKNWPAILIPADPGQGVNDDTILKVNLIGTQKSLATLLSGKQPRVWSDSDTSSNPIYLKEIATLHDPFGSLRTEQVYIPLSQNGLVDRIRIDRVRGSFHLFQVDLYRLGNRSQ